jgi:hypothetical protein
MKSSIKFKGGIAPKNQFSWYQRDGIDYDYSLMGWFAFGTVVLWSKNHNLNRSADRQMPRNWEVAA